MRRGVTLVRNRSLRGIDMSTRSMNARLMERAVRSPYAQSSTLPTQGRHDHRNEPENDLAGSAFKSVSDPPAPWRRWLAEVVTTMAIAMLGILSSLVIETVQDVHRPFEFWQLGALFLLTVAGLLTAASLARYLSRFR